MGGQALDVTDTGKVGDEDVVVSLESAYFATGWAGPSGPLFTFTPNEYLF